MNRDIERKERRREELQVNIAAEQSQTEIYTWPEIVFSDELESELKQAVYSQTVELFSESGDRPSAKSALSDINPEIVRRFGERLVERGEEMALENSPEAAELAAEIENSLLR